MKLYLVWSGEYDFVAVEAIFDDFEDAMQYVQENWRSLNYYVWIEERRLGGSAYRKTLFDAKILGYGDDEKEIVEAEYSKKLSGERDALRRGYDEQEE